MAPYIRQISYTVSSKLLLNSVRRTFITKRTLLISPHVFSAILLGKTQPLKFRGKEKISFLVNICAHFPPLLRKPHQGFSKRHHSGVFPYFSKLRVFVDVRNRFAEGQVNRFKAYWSRDAPPTV